MCQDSFSFEDIFRMKVTDSQHHYGTIFETNNWLYLYDAGTGKVIRVDHDIEKLIKAFFDKNCSANDFREIWNSLPELKKSYTLSFIQKEHLFARNSALAIYPSFSNSYVSDFSIRQVIFELTGKCNLRCRYCLYNDYNEHDREFNNCDMTLEIATKALDYIYDHSSSEIAITFYGGEPLLNFPLMKEIIEISKKKFSDRQLTFSFTSNMTLMTQEIAEYLAQVPGMSIVISLDGPMQIHDQNRIYANGSKTYYDVMKGIQILADAVIKFSSPLVVSFNSVFMPPYTQEKLDQINKFFEEMDAFPTLGQMRITYPAYGSVPKNILQQVYSEYGKLADGENPLFDWIVHNTTNDNFLKITNNLYFSQLRDILLRIHSRYLVDSPLPIAHRNGCCIPGQRRLYVTTTGYFKVCERIGNSPSIGNVYKGLDFDVIKNYYFEQYDCLSQSICQKCWAYNLCSLCYACCYNENGVDEKMKSIYCNAEKSYLIESLKLYYSLLETSPDQLLPLVEVQQS